MPYFRSGRRAPAEVSERRNLDRGSRREPIPAIGFVVPRDFFCALFHESTRAYERAVSGVGAGLDGRSFN